MFNIKTLAVAATTTVHLRDAEGNLLYADGKKPEDRLPLTITVYGPGSKEYAKASAAAQNRALDRFKRKGKADQTADEKAEETARFLAACTVSFNNFNYPVDEGVDQHKAFYLDQTLGYMTEQVNREMGDWANFTSASATS